ncbi:MAG: hypothetical protein AAGF11_42380 [Myxococcota bacterium]
MLQSLSQSLSFRRGDAPEILDRLRISPETTMGQYLFVVRDECFCGSYRGGACGLRCTKIGDGSYALTTTPTVNHGPINHYYFPYRSEGEGGVGECSVPRGSANGTVVVTGGMNGCALQVNRGNDNQLRFYHDANGRSLRRRSDIGGAVLCRIPYGTYSPNDIGIQSAGEAMAKGRGKAFFVYYLISIKVNGRWKVYASGIIEDEHEHRTRIPGGELCVGEFSED